MKIRRSVKYIFISVLLLALAAISAAQADLNAPYAEDGTNGCESFFMPLSSSAEAADGTEPPAGRESKDSSQQPTLSNLISSNPKATVGLTLLLLLTGSVTLVLITASRNRYKNALFTTEKQGELIKLMTDSMNVGLLVREASGDFHMTYVHDNLCKLLGYSRSEFEQVTGSALAALIDRDDPVELHNRVVSTLTKSDRYEVQYQLRNKEGNYIWVQDTGKKFIDTDGKVRLNCVLTDITPLREAMEDLRTMAEYDTVCPIYNRHTFYRRAKKLLSDNPDIQYVIICCDIARFKIFNDIYGIAGGNRLLYCIGDRLRKAMQGIGECARLYADNFVICMPLDKFNADRLAVTIERELNSFGFDFEFVPNIGIYLIDDRSVPVELMCDRAGIAQQSVKSSCEKLIAWYDNEFRSRLLKEQQITNDMKQALKNGEFELWLQPQYSLTTEKITGAEALVRWRHPEKGYIMPSDFIPVFEKNGFITRLDLYMFESVCRLLRRWKDEGKVTVPIAVNLSRVDIFNANLCETLCALTEKYSLSTAEIKLEITESAFIREPEQLINVVKQLRAKGFRIEMDDFGSGYSSLNALKDMPVDLLKLDMKFLSSEGNTQRGGNILNSVVRMTNWLSLPVLAEGVETREQAEYLKSIGCLLVQGYLYSKPVPVSSFEKLTLITEPPAAVAEATAQETAESLSAENFWNPEAQATLLFNNILDAAIIMEYYEGALEALQTNDKFYTVTAGLTREEFAKCSRDILSLLLPDDREAFELVVKQTIESKKETETESRWCAGPGTEYIWLRVRLRCIAATNGRFILYAAIENITEKKKLQEALCESEKTLHAAIAHSKMLVWEFDPGSRSSALCRPSAKLSGLPERLTEFPESLAAFDVIHPEDLPVILEAHRKLAAGSENESFTVRIKYPDGRYHLERAWLTAIYDGCGKFVKGVGTSEEITAAEDGAEQC